MLPNSDDTKASQRQTFEIEQAPTASTISRGKPLNVPLCIGVGIGVSTFLIVIVILHSAPQGADMGALGRVAHKGLADLSDTFPEKVRGTPITYWVQTALPEIGSCFEDEPELHDALLLFRQRAIKETIAAAKDAKVENGKAQHLLLEIAMLTDDYGAWRQLTNLLTTGKDNDVHGLFAKALLELAEAPEDKVQEVMDGSVSKLKEASASAGEALEAIHHKVVEAFSSGGFLGDAAPSPTVVPPKLQADRQELQAMTGQSVAILVFGWGPEKGGKIPETLRDRLDAAKKMAEMFRYAPIIIAGGATNSVEIESVFIRRQLIKEYKPALGEKKEAIRERITCATNSRDTLGVPSVTAEIIQQRKIKKIILVSSAWQLPRIALTMEAALKVRGLEPTLYLAATGNRPHMPGTRTNELAVLKERMGIERKAAYRDRARALNLFAYCDYEGYR